MSTLGFDLVLEATFRGFDNGEVVRKSQMILEQARPLPTGKTGCFIECQNVPCGGKVEISLHARPISGAQRPLRSETRVIPNRGPFAKTKGLYNGSQVALSHVPVVGRTLEKIVPDGCQTLDVRYAFEVGADRLLKYRVTVTKGRLEDVLVTVDGDWMF
jgi:hypothetical protein